MGALGIVFFSRGKFSLPVKKITRASLKIMDCPSKKKKYRLRGRSSETAKAHRG
eukprot:TRINITY_DN2469_c0_g1_i1.p3 TRINITY_DN2469_c0_g1~~TRINITY_DN2469_c0_g1_i1.p3  ORF type:complete len:54 (+),score=30.09 TRINITY_DN2469_c0_g1_i1:159-320(+)